MLRWIFHGNYVQRRANPNPDLDLNPDLASFPNPVDLDLKILGEWIWI